MRAVVGAAGVALALAMCAGCAPAPADDTDVRWLGFDRFVVEVQPILAEACGNPTCHGRPERPLAIFSPGRWRADPDRLYLDEPLTADELEHNYTLSCVFSTEAELPRDAMLVRKPLAGAAGVYHGGGAVFDDTSDRSYRAIVTWLEAGWSP